MRVTCPPVCHQVRAQFHADSKTETASTTTTLTPETWQGYIDLEDDEDTDQSAPGLTVAQKRFLVNSMTKLLKISYGEFFRQPPNYLDHALNKIDLRTMRSKLHDGHYLSVDDLRGDFDLTLHGSVVGNGAQDKLTGQARRLRTAFEGYMSDFPGKSEECPPRKKARTREPEATFTQNAGSSSSSPRSSSTRAAKTVMLGRTYPKDHW